MPITDVIRKLSIIQRLFEENELSKAKRILLEMAIVDTQEHLALPKHIRYLIWHLYEYLVIEDTQNVTDRDTILKEFQELSSHQ